MAFRGNRVRAFVAFGRDKSILGYVRPVLGFVFLGYAPVLFSACLAFSPATLFVLFIDACCWDSILLTHLLDLLLVVEPSSYFKCYLLALILVIILTLVHRGDFFERLKVTIGKLVSLILPYAIAAQGVHVARSRRAHQRPVIILFVKNLSDALLRLGDIRVSFGRLLFFRRHDKAVLLRCLPGSSLR